jgi:hypothetical protein
MFEFKKVELLLSSLWLFPIFELEMAHRFFLQSLGMIRIMRMVIFFQCFIFIERLILAGSYFVLSYLLSLSVSVYVLKSILN